MREEKQTAVTWAVVAFLLGNLTGVFGTVALFGADLRELKVRVAAVELKVGQIERARENELVMQAGRGRTP